MKYKQTEKTVETLFSFHEIVCADQMIVLMMDWLVAMAADSFTAATQCFKADGRWQLNNHGATINATFLV